MHTSRPTCCLSYTSTTALLTLGSGTQTDVISGAESQASDLIGSDIVRQIHIVHRSPFFLPGDFIAIIFATGWCCPLDLYVALANVSCP